MTIIKRIVFTDLDGTLLDHTSYSYTAALPALDKLKLTQTPLIMVSSKTRPEIEALRSEIDNCHPFIVENGGAIYIPNDLNPALDTDNEHLTVQRIPEYRVILLGRPAADIHPLFDKLAEALPVKALSAMQPSEIAALTGLSLSQAAAAASREYGEAFILEDSTIPEAALRRAVHGLGLSLTRGGRFYHLLGENDKGLAVRILVGLYRKSFPDLISAGIGDAPNDEPMLAAVDCPFLVARPDGSHAEMNIAGLERIPLAGPHGFREAMRRFLTNDRAHGE